jgi:transposase-like protein
LQSRQQIYHGPSGKDPDGLFVGRHVDRDVLILRVRWFLRYELGLSDLVEMMAEQELSLSHTSIPGCVQRDTAKFVKRRNRFATHA